MNLDDIDDPTERERIRRIRELAAIEGGLTQDFIDRQWHVENACRPSEPGPEIDPFDPLADVREGIEHAAPPRRYDYHSEAQAFLREIREPLYDPKKDPDAW